MIRFPIFPFLSFVLLLSALLTACTQDVSQIDPGHQLPPDPAQAHQKQQANQQELADQLGLTQVAFTASERANPVVIELAPLQHSDSNMLVSMDAEVTTTEGVVREVRWQQIHGPAGVIVDPFSAHTQV